MKIYLACSGMMCKTYGDMLIPRFCEPEPRFHELKSYHELLNFSGHTLETYGKDVFLDSGAYSAYAQGKEISVEEYGDFLEKYQGQYEVAANLDSIPKSRGKEDVTIAAEQSMLNQMKLEARGLDVIPVYHMGEPSEYLAHYLENYDYIALGGLVDSGEYERFFETCWADYLTDGAGRPTHKVHGFGMTSIENLIKYPWYSVDSSTWLTHSKIGYISFPQKRADGTFNFSLRPTLVAMSENSTARERVGEHYDNMSEAQKEGIREYLALWDLTPEELRLHPAPRFVANMEYWLAIEANANFQTEFKTHQIELL